MEENNDNIPDDEMALARSIARTEADNAAFRALPSAQIRVAIARDVLKWLEMGKLSPVNLLYIAVHYNPDHDDPRIVNGSTCEACALGALFAAAAERRMSPSLAVNNCWSARKMRAKLRPWFDITQLHLIESAFEGFRSMAGDAWPAVQKFRDTILLGTPEENRPIRLMAAIMQNIIDNEGTFKP